MATKRTDQQPKSRYSRRNFVTWTGQVVAGISLAAIGLELAGSNTALAKTNQADCTPCPPYGTLYKEHCGLGGVNCPNPNNYISYKYIYTGGCVITGQSCPTTESCFAACVTGCNCTG